MLAMKHVIDSAGWLLVFALVFKQICSSTMKDLPTFTRHLSPPKFKPIHCVVPPHRLENEFGALGKGRKFIPSILYFWHAKSLFN